MFQSRGTAGTYLFVLQKRASPSPPPKNRSVSVSSDALCLVWGAATDQRTTFFFGLWEPPDLVRLQELQVWESRRRRDEVFSAAKLNMTANSLNAFEENLRTATESQQRKGSHCELCHIIFCICIQWSCLRKIWTHTHRPHSCELYTKKKFCLREIPWMQSNDVGTWGRASWVTKTALP